MKKLLILFVIAVLAVTVCLPLSACGESEPLPPPSGNNDNMFMDNDFAGDTDLLPPRVKEVKVTLAGDATYADGSVEKIWKTGDTLKFGTDIIYTGEIPEGKVIGGWFDEKNRYYKGADFDVERNDVTIMPALDVPQDKYAPTSGGTAGGKLGTGEQRVDGGNNTTAYLAEWRDGIVDGEIGGVYHFVAGERDVAPDPEGKIPVGFCFTNQTPYEVIAANGYTVNYRIQNLGEEDVTVKVRQSNTAAGAYQSKVVTDPITIKAGEVKSASLEFENWKNGNVLNAVELMNEVSELNLGIIKSITVFDPSTKTYKLTLEGGAKLENGNTSGDFRAGDTVKLVYTPAEDEILTGWANANNPAETFPVGDFTMPKKDITLKPITAENKKYAFNVQGGTISEGGTSGSFAPTDKISLTCDSVPEGKVLAGWYNVEDRSEVYDAAVIEMPAKDLTVAPMFDVENYFYSDKTYVGKIAPDGGLYSGKEKGCYSVYDTEVVGAVKGEDGSAELGSIYHFKGGSSAAPAEMAVGSHFLTTFMNNWVTGGVNVPERTVITTVENFGNETVTLRFAFVKASSNPNSQYGEKTVTIEAGASVTFEFNVTYLHNSFMTNIMVKDHAVSEVHIGMYQYISDAVQS